MQITCTFSNIVHKRLDICRFLYLWGLSNQFSKHLSRCSQFCTHSSGFHCVVSERMDTGLFVTQNKFPTCVYGMEGVSSPLFLGASVLYRQNGVLGTWMEA